jgi:hypothetical protein
MGEERVRLARDTRHVAFVERHIKCTQRYSASRDQHVVIKHADDCSRPDEHCTPLLRPASPRTGSDVVIGAVCGATFKRAADGSEVTCDLPPNHSCAHAWGVRNEGAPPPIPFSDECDACADTIYPESKHIYLCRAHYDRLASR